MKEYKIEGMTCDHCRNRVETALRALDPKAEVNLETEIALVDETIESALVKVAVESAGYHVK